MKKFELNDLEKSCDEETEELYKRFETDDFIVALTNFLQRKSKLWTEYSNKNFVHTKKRQYKQFKLIASIVIVIGVGIFISAQFYTHF